MRRVYAIMSAVIRMKNNTLKEYILQKLEDGERVSGEAIANEAHVSRAFVWKTVDSLRSEGYVIDAVQNGGYTLGASDVISERSIRKYLKDGLKNAVIEIHDVLPSTNAHAKTMAADGCAEWTLVCAKSQTAGKGRGDHTFHSPSGSGVYMSVVLRPDIPADKVLLLTTAAAVAAAETIEEVSGKATGIKWVNDVYIGRKKVCGILSEASFSLENFGMDYDVIGIGINAYVPEGGFPADIASIAGAVSEKPIKDMRSRLIAGIMNRMSGFYGNIISKPFLGGYDRRLMFRGEKVRVIGRENEKEAVLVGVDDDFRLLVTYPDGRNELLSSGEISVKQ